MCYCVLLNLNVFFFIWVTLYMYITSNIASLSQINNINQIWSSGIMSSILNRCVKFQVIKKAHSEKKWPYFFLYMVEITKSISQQQHNMLLIYVLITKSQARHRRQKYLVSFLFWIWISVSQNIKFYIHHKNSFWGENFEKKTDDEWWYLNTI